MSDIALLVVEDDSDSMAVVTLMLNPANIDTSEAVDAEQALQILNANPNAFSGVIIDLALPGMDGFALLQTIRKSPALKNLPCIAMTAFHTPELKSKAIRSGFDAYFPKPLDTAVFLGTLERLLNR
jgi:CheY-like chemotaxis protein